MKIAKAALIPTVLFILAGCLVDISWTAGGKQADSIPFQESLRRRIKGPGKRNGVRHLFLLNRWFSWLKRWLWPVQKNNYPWHTF